MSRRSTDRKMFMNTILTIVRNRELIWEVALRDLKGGSKGAVLGVLWIVINPFIQVVAYVTIVSLLFRIRLDGSMGTFDYASYVLAGMIPWQILAKSITDAPMLIRSNTDIVKQIIYPIETLPLTNLLMSCFGGCIQLLVLFTILLFTNRVAWTLILFPVALFFLLLFLLGISWILSIAGVVFKDLRDIVGVLMTLLIYFSPVILQESMTGSSLWRYVMVNPLSHIIISFRDIFLGSFHLWSWIIFLGYSIGVFLLGNFAMRKAKQIINEYI
jgi:lipopolysaccharide transport system permease protein